MLFTDDFPICIIIICFRNTMLVTEVALLTLIVLDLTGDCQADIDPFADSIPFAIKWHGPLDDAAEQQVWPLRTIYDNIISVERISLNIVLVSYYNLFLHLAFNWAELLWCSNCSDWNVHVGTNRAVPCENVTMASALWNSQKVNYINCICRLICYFQPLLMLSIFRYSEFC